MYMYTGLNPCEYHFAVCLGHLILELCEEQGTMIVIEAPTQ